MRQRSFSRRHIAIVDNDRSVLRAAARFFESNSLPAKTYTSASEFLGSLEVEVPSCLVTDLQMPKMDGLQLLRHLAGNGYRIPTIVITANDAPGIRRRCELAGAMLFLSKPANLDSLLKAAQSAMEWELVKYG
ncbi:MAG TPA: response regulator [Rhizomicrobium sp.]|nr:response regulator [Rhizomicrobium sp.]